MIQGSVHPQPLQLEGSEPPRPSAASPPQGPVVVQLGVESHSSLRLGEVVEDSGRITERIRERVMGPSLIVTQSKPCNVQRSIMKEEGSRSLKNEINMRRGRRG